VTVTVLPESVAGPERIEKLTGSPEEAVAPTMKGWLASERWLRASNVIVCLTGSTPEPTLMGMVFV
jgi:hypothetical protein